MKTGAPGSFGAQLKAFREAAGFTQEELATISGLSVYAVSALERGERRRPHLDTVRALSAALDLTGPTRDLLLGSARAPANPAAADESSAGALPLALTPLLGREADLQTLRRWLADPTARLITLLGPGGVGKTRLALELARAIAEEGRTCVVFVPLGTVGDATFVAPCIADALGLSNVTAVDLPARVRAVCEDQATLLVLDNCEHVLDAAPLVADCLTASASLRLLATSRAPLRVRGEREYVVGSLALDPNLDGLSPADLARIPAVRLFVERVRDVQPDFRLTAANGPTVTAICRRLDALPLALELAAPWMKVLTPEDLCDRLDHDVLLSSAGPRDLPERQQTMSATVAWSYQLLDPDEQRTFRRLAALPARFPIEAAAAVLDGRDATSQDTVAAIAAAADLIDKSLLVRADTASRPLYQMLETVRAYATLELLATEERDDAMEGLVRYCTGEASRAASGLVGTGQGDWLDRVRDDLENYRVVLAWLIEHGRAAEACAIAWGLMFFWLIRGRASEGLQWYERCLQVSPLAPEVESRALVGAAVLWFPQGEHARARDAVTRALALGSAEHDVAVLAGHLLGHVEQTEGNLNGARDRFTSSIEGFRKLDIPWGIGNALIAKAGLAFATANLEQGERLLDEATAVLRRAGPWFLNQPLYVRAILAVRRGAADEAIALVRRALSSSRQIHDKFGYIYALTPLAAAAVVKGDYPWAARILGMRDGVTERTGATSVDRSVKELRERTEQEVRERLGPDRWARAHAAGRSASIDALLKDIESKRRPTN
jgi:predicted ATPase/DNA-binding XRE family transcriptional regulator